MLVVASQSVRVTPRGHIAPELCFLLSGLPDPSLSTGSANCHLCLALYFTKFDNKTILLPAGIFADYLKILFPEKKVLLFLTTDIIKKNYSEVILLYFCFIYKCILGN